MTTSEMENIILSLQNEIYNLSRGHIYLKDRMMFMEESIAISRARIIVLEALESKDEEKAAKEIYMKPIEEFEFSVRINNCLKCENIYLIGDLVYQTEIDLRRTPNLGNKSIIEIKDVLKANNLSFGMEIDWPPNSELSRYTPREQREEKEIQRRSYE